MVHSLNYGGFPEIPLVLSSFGGENVAGKCMSSFYFAGTGLFKALGGSSICLDLGHTVLLLFLKILISIFETISKLRNPKIS